MTRDDRNGKVVRYWLAKAREALAAARDEAAAGRLGFAVNRVYYAAFYAASAVLLGRGHHFVKHSGVRAGFHLHLVKAGLLDAQWGHLYDQLFDARLEGDYVEFASFEADEVGSMIERADRLINLLAAFADPGSTP